jgi:hypothetical protein
MTPLVSALVANAWLAFVTLFFWWFRLRQLAGKSTIAGVPAMQRPPTRAFAFQKYG